LGNKYHEKRIERLTYYFGKIGINLRESKITSLELGSLPTSNILKGQRVVIAVDGGRTRIRINKKGRRKVKTNRVGFTGEWISPKLLTIYVVNEQGEKIRNGEIPITNDGTYKGYQGFLQILEMYLVNLGISQAKQVLLIADGAEWIWIHIPPAITHDKYGQACFVDPQLPTSIFDEACPYLSREDVAPFTEKVKMPTGNLSIIRFFSRCITFTRL
jgi:hypothetical protein